MRARTSKQCTSRIIDDFILTSQYSILMTLMREEKIDFQELEEKISKELAKLGSTGLYQRGILATCVNNFVTARRLRFVADKLSLYCWTYRTRKYEQILKNPQVAVVIGFVQVEGKAVIRGHPMDKKNEQVIEVLKKTQPEFYESYRHAFENRDEMYLIEIVPERITLPDMDGISVLNLKSRTAHIVSGANWSELQEDHKDAPAYWENVV